MSAKSAGVPIAQFRRPDALNLALGLQKNGVILSSHLASEHRNSEDRKLSRDIDKLKSQRRMESATNESEPSSTKTLGYPISSDPASCRPDARCKSSIRRRTPSTTCASRSSVAEGGQCSCDNIFLGRRDRGWTWLHSDDRQFTNANEGTKASFSTTLQPRSACRCWSSPSE